MYLRTLVVFRGELIRLVYSMSKKGHPSPFPLSIEHVIHTAMKLADALNLSEYAIEIKW
jgi:hypothetical protein